MIEEQKINKLVDLTQRAISINENLLAEERKFVEALSERKDIDYLKASSDTIHLLMRKESLFNQAAKMVLEKTSAS